MGSVKKFIKRLMERTIPSSAILMFHHVDDSPPICKSGCLLAFEKFKELFDDPKRFDSLENVVNSPKRRKIAVTFDDGLTDLYTMAYPFLKSKGIPFTAFIITDFLGTPGYITEDQLKEMAADPLVTIGSHGTSHAILKGMPVSEQERELKKSQRVLEKITEKAVDVFAYSHGQYDSETLDLVKSYRYACSVRSLPLNAITAKQRYLLPRYNVENGTFDEVKNKLKKIVKA